MDLNNEEDATWELEEVCPVFRAILSKHMPRQCFIVTESLGLLLRKQRDEEVFLDHPQDEQTNRFIWRQVFEHIARENLDVQSGLWRVDLNAELFVNQPLLGQVTELDYNLPTRQHPTDTIRPTRPRTRRFSLHMVPVVTATNHHPYDTMAQRYATMNALQQPILVFNRTDDAEFRLHSSLHPDDIADALRLHGAIYPLPSLYDMYQGRQPPLRSLSSVRQAIQRFLDRDPDKHSDASFTDEELCCLLRALLDGTIQPDLYRGCALSVALIDALQAYVDNEANRNIQFARTSQS